MYNNNSISELGLLEIQNVAGGAHSRINSCMLKSKLVIIGGTATAGLYFGGVYGGVAGFVVGALGVIAEELFIQILPSIINPSKLHAGQSLSGSIPPLELLEKYQK